MIPDRHDAATKTALPMTTSNSRALKPSRLSASWLDDAAAQLGTNKTGLVARVLAYGLLPVETGDFRPEPDPAATFEEACSRVERIRREEDGAVSPACATRLMGHGRRTRKAFLLIHGLTNSPMQFEDLGRILHDRGHTVYIPLMPLHGRVSHDVRELAALTADDLRAFADRSADIAAGLGEEVHVVGVSGGANVAVWLAQNRADLTGRSLFIAPFFKAAGVPAFVSRILLNAAARLPNVAFEDSDVVEREWVYRGQSSRGVAAVWQLIQSVAAQARRGEKPAGKLIVLTTAVDNTSDNVPTRSLISDWRRAGADVEAIEFDETLDIAHNSLDPAADPAKRDVVHARILALLGEANPVQHAPR